MFEVKRKIHYNEFAAVQLAKKLMSEEGEEDEQTEPTPSGSHDKSSSPKGPKSPKEKHGGVNIDTDIPMTSDDRP